MTRENVDAVDDRKQTKLHRAAAERSVVKVRRLLDLGANVNAKDRNDETPLHYGAKSNSFETVQLLVARGADVNALLFISLKVDKIGLSNMSKMRGQIDMKIGATVQCCTVIAKMSPTTCESRSAIHRRAGRMKNKLVRKNISYCTTQSTHLQVCRHAKERER